MDGLTWLDTATTAALNLFSTVIDTITTNSVLSICFVAGTMIPLGIKMFKRFRKAC